MTIAYGWIYIGAYAENLNKCKIGFSRVSELARFKQTTHAPDYVPFRFYKVPMEDLIKLEKYLHNELSGHFTRIKHLLSGALSECFNCSPTNAAYIIEYELTKCLDLDTNPNGFSLDGIIFQPDYTSYISSGAWQDHHQDFLNLFLDETGRNLPFTSFRDWDDY